MKFRGVKCFNCLVVFIKVMLFLEFELKKRFMSFFFFVLLYVFFNVIK